MRGKQWNFQKKNMKNVPKITKKTIFYFRSKSMSLGFNTTQTDQTTVTITMTNTGQF